MPSPNVFIGHTAGDFLPAADWDSNFALIEGSLEGVGNFVVSGLLLSGGTGLSVNVTAGTALVGGLITVGPMAVMGLAPSTTNYVYLLQNGGGTHNTTGVAPANSVLLGTATTSGSAVTAEMNVLPGAPYAPRNPFGHLLLGGGNSPLLALNAGAGTSPPAPLLNSGNDVRGSISWGTGTSPAAGSQLTLFFICACSANPYVFLTPQNDDTAALLPFVTGASTSGFVIAAHNAPAASQPNTTFTVTYLVIS